MKESTIRTVKQKKTLVAFAYKTESSYLGYDEQFLYSTSQQSGTDGKDLILMPNFSTEVTKIQFLQKF